MPFDGLRVLSLESRRAEEMATLIRKQGGEGFVAPSMREVPLEKVVEAFAFAESLLRGEFDCVVLLTGVGTRLLWKTLLTRYTAEELTAALGKLTIVVRGPKPSAAIREIGLPPDVHVPEPNTWRELLEVMRGRPESRIALQEYGKSNEDLVNGLRATGKQIFRVPIYAWDLPEDTGPLRQAAARLVAGEFDVVMFTTSMQVVNLFRIAEEEGIAAQVREALQSAVVASIGRTTTETLEDYGIRPDCEPSHPKMGLLVNETGGRAGVLLASKEPAKRLQAENQ